MWSCWRMVRFVVLFCCDIADGNELADVWFGTPVDSPCIWFPISHEAFSSMNSAVKRYMAGILGAFEELAVIMDRVIGMKVAISAQFRRGERVKCCKLCLSFHFHQFRHSWIE